MFSADPPDTKSKIPVLLLKTPSSPSDSYRDHFSGAFAPHFVPVLEHQFNKDGLSLLQSILAENRCSEKLGSSYGGMIFTSQRAVEAFASVVNSRHGEADSSWPGLQHVPIYSVGPATTRALSAVPQSPTPLQIFGEHTGNGEALAIYILDHYDSFYPERQSKPPLLFLVGEQRRDIIPKTLMNPDLPSHRRIRVDEEVVYHSGSMESFPKHLESLLRETKDAEERWIVVFSPTGCGEMLEGLGLVDPRTGRVVESIQSRRDGKTFIATIGPTTKAHLETNYGFEPDVCAATPSPEGVLQGILDYKSRKSS